MPIYEYKCGDCGLRFEELVPRVQSESLPCPKCKSPRTEKLMSVIGGIASGASGSEAPCASSGACPSAGMCGQSCPRFA
jgi:putative FmdB family regulatory protein